MLAKNLSIILKIYKDIIAGLDTAHQLQAILDKIQSIIVVGAQDLIKKLQRQYIIDSKQIYLIKTNINSNFIKRKARQIT